MNKIEQRIKELEIFKEENNYHEGMFKGFKEALKLKDEEIKEKIKKLKEELCICDKPYFEPMIMKCLYHDKKIDEIFSEELK